MKPAQLALRDPYGNLRHFWLQTFERNPLFYVLAAVGLITSFVPFKDWKRGSRDEDESENQNQNESQHDGKTRVVPAVLGPYRHDCVGLCLAQAAGALLLRVPAAHCRSLRHGGGCYARAIEVLGKGKGPAPCAAAACPCCNDSGERFFCSGAYEASPGPLHPESKKNGPP